MKWTTHVMPARKGPERRRKLLDFGQLTPIQEEAVSQKLLIRWRLVSGKPRRSAIFAVEMTALAFADAQQHSPHLARRRIDLRLLWSPNCKRK
jgi:hypothetical protein